MIFATVVNVLSVVTILYMSSHYTTESPYETLGWSAQDTVRVEDQLQITWTKRYNEPIIEVVQIDQDEVVSRD